MELTIEYGFVSLKTPDLNSYIGIDQSKVLFFKVLAFAH